MLYFRHQGGILQYLMAWGDKSQRRESHDPDLHSWPLIGNHPHLFAIKHPEMSRTLTHTLWSSTNAVLPVWSEAFDLSCCYSCSLTHTAHSSFWVLSLFVWRLPARPFVWSWLLFSICSCLPHRAQWTLASTSYPTVTLRTMSSWYLLILIKVYISITVWLGWLKMWSFLVHLKINCKCVKSCLNQWITTRDGR